MTDTVDTLMFKARHLSDPQPSLQRPHIHHRLNLKAIAIKVKLGQYVPPESVIAVAEVAVLATEQQPYRHHKAHIAHPSQR